MSWGEKQMAPRNNTYFEIKQKNIFVSEPKKNLILQFSFKYFFNNFRFGISSSS